MISAVLFDLDGTLIHSAPGILAGFNKVLGEAGLTPRETVDERVIGPPLLQTLKRLTGMDDGPELQRIAASFRDIYDTVGVQLAEPYPQLIETLQVIAASGRDSYMVTNKRIVPTRLIADRLGMTALMRGLYSPDYFNPPLPRKGAVVEFLLAHHGVNAANAVLVGDSVEDAEAAASNGVRFIAVSYGYGNPGAFTGTPASAALERLGELPAVLARLD
jgi:phosphoglycolate phosphatase